ncbi:putative membrane protein [Halobacteroides halobius DSM 5150]|uniref:Putative membrane protein n=1 Tax=Halobacteroides halobius (strain ATCC 35273 / DSM 5150 / MD-1) TaxID=748449 RepID=L0KAM5_HALHC|nr:putative sulfate exporter family transporter [Halobacteroides halobius]AGB41600.1 putative membrane protein [Halobacteroides halobius DSM 5150]
MKGKISKKTPGVLLTIIIGLSARYLANWIPNLGGVTLAILCGALIKNTLGVNSTYTSGVYFAKKKILSLAIILMGLKLQLAILAQLGLAAVLIIIIMVVATISLGYLWGQYFGLSRSFSLLLGIGNGVCGSSAIGATAPLIAQDEEEIGLSIGVVNLLGTLGIFLLPVLTYLLNLAEAESSIMIGGTLQAVGQVVAAGFSINERIGNLATVIKMGRILMLGPIVLLLSLFTNQETKKESKVTIPFFIIGFFVFSLVGSFNLLPVIVSSYLQNFSKILLTIAMTAIGLEIKLTSLINQGPKALLTGGLVFISQLILIISLIYFIY